MKKLCLIATLCLALTACGDDKDPGNPFEDARRGEMPSGMPTGMPPGMPGMPGGMPAGLPGPDMLKAGGKIKLTDDMMERYVKVVKELKGLEGRPGAALLARHNFDVQQWVGVSMIIGSSSARSAMAGVRPKLEEQLASLKAERDAADAAQQPMLDRQIEMLEGQLESLGGIGEANEVDKHNMEVLERWQDRLDAAGK